MSSRKEKNKAIWDEFVVKNSIKKKIQLPAA